MKPLTRGFKRKVCEAKETAATVDQSAWSQIQSLLPVKEDNQSQHTLDPVENSQSQHSADLFKSQSSHHMSTDSANNNIQIRKQLNLYTWIQCDDLGCQKWRRVKADEISHVGPDDAWFCHMNTNVDHNTCSAVEEDYAFYDRLAKKVGIKFVMSQLKLGTLVWAKMSGYCRWPAVVTKDPDKDCHCVQDQDGDVLSYHVEFLGKTHSHSWITANHVVAYGKKEETTLDMETKKKKRRQNLTHSSTKKPLKQIYKNMRIVEAVEEANKLQELSIEARLAQCIFIPKEFPDTSHKHGLMFERRVPQNGGHDVKFGTGKNGVRCETARTLCFSCEKSLPKHPKVPWTNGQKLSSKTKPVELKSRNINHTVPVNSPTLPDCRSPQIKPKEFSSNTMKFGSTLMNKTKEEKFKIDIEMYRRNERAFEHDVRRFMIRNHANIHKLPCWQNVHISLFQLFLTVFERGGYNKVCKNREWASVSRELTDTYNSNTSTSAAARKYYYKNLYPYELYVKGKAYQDLFKKDKSKDKPKIMNKGCDMHVQSVKDKPNDKKDVYLFDEASEASTSNLETLLQELDSYSHDCQIGAVDEFMEKPTLNVTLYDESPATQLSPGLVLADTASEFGHADIPGEIARQDRKMDSSNSGSEDQDLILHEMQALDNELTAINEELTDLF
ncbi:hypothetical protein ScPMuIL_015062 [Solemya velum]